jgi:hypothetical protein
VLFVWPGAGQLKKVNGVLVMDGPNENLREQQGLRLVREGYAHVLLFSEGHYPLVRCPNIPGAHVVCFEPKPARTVGEVEFAARYAKAHGWHSILVVPGHAQATRARLLMSRCFKGRAIVVPARAPGAPSLLLQVAYEWGALVKALIFDPGC